jgi:hypothetical protein
MQKKKKKMKEKVVHGNVTGNPCRAILNKNVFFQKQRTGR